MLACFCSFACLYQFNSFIFSPTLSSMSQQLWLLCITNNVFSYFCYSFWPHVEIQQRCIVRYKLVAVNNVWHIAVVNLLFFRNLKIFTLSFSILMYLFLVKLSLEAVVHFTSKLHSLCNIAMVSYQPYSFINILPFKLRYILALLRKSFLKT